MKLRDYDKDKNYIGRNKTEYFFTYWIHKLCPEISFVSYVHDLNYFLLYANSSHLVRFFVKIMYDLVFLIMGVIRNLRKLNLLGVVMTVVLYLVLLISTPYVLFQNRNRLNDLTKRF
jgi:hypothetical protein